MPNCNSQAPCSGFKTMCGGQALIEGIMMRGPKKQSIVVRRQDGGLEVCRWGAPHFAAQRGRSLGDLRL